MASPYQEFARKARERFLERQKKKASGTGQYVFTLHSQYKMKQYGLSEQKVRGVIRNPRRREEGIVKNTVAVMQPVSSKTVNGKDVWKQEVWVMYVVKSKGGSQKAKTITKRVIPSEAGGSREIVSGISQLKIISAWRYPGISPKRNPIPDEILRELEDGSILEAGE